MLSAGNFTLSAKCKRKEFASRLIQSFSGRIGLYNMPEEANKSGSALFVIKSVNLYQQPGLSNLIS